MNSVASISVSNPNFIWPGSYSLFADCQPHCFQCHLSFFDSSWFSARSFDIDYPVHCFLLVYFLKFHLIFLFTGSIVQFCF